MKLKSTVLAFSFLALMSHAAETNRCMTSAAEMLNAYRGNPSDAWCFALTGTVTWCRARNAILQDDSGRCNLFNLPDYNLKRGSRVVLTGAAHINNIREAWIDHIYCEHLGEEKLPAPDRITLEDCNDTARNLEVVRTEATVIDVRTDELDPGFDWLILKDGPSLLTAVRLHAPENRKLIDARVELTGPIFAKVMAIRQYANPFIVAELDDAVKVLAPPAGDPFDFPLFRPERYASPSDIERLGKHTAVGKIVATWRPNNGLLMTDDGLYIRLSFAASEILPACGSTVRAAGYPSSDLFTVWLARAKVRPEPLPDIDEGLPRETSAAQLRGNLSTDRESYGNWIVNRLISLRGLVRAYESHNDGTCRAVLDCDGTTIPVDFSTHPAAFDEIAVGSEIKVTGRCLLLNERWNPNNVFPSINGLLLVLTTTPEVLHGPDWWTTNRLLTVIAVLLVALVAVLLRSVFARRLARIKLNERTQLAVEVHDSLSQALTGLAFQVSAAQDSVDTDLPTTKSKLSIANQILKSCRTELRNCLFDLRNDTVSEKNFSKAILRTLEPFEDSATLSVRFNVNRALFDDTTAHAVLIIIRELVANAIRHGDAWTVKIAGAVEKGQLLFSVTDDGSGFDFDHRPGSEEGHFGLDGVRERLAKLDGEISYSTPRTGGTRAVVKIPLHLS